GMQAILPMAGALNHMGMLVPPYCMFFYNKNMVDKSEDNWMKTDLALVGHNVFKLCKTLKDAETKDKNSWGYDF
ncbi:MAG: hypothetical protein Q8Q06_02960, partial [bacterium]|nr:hypothetical protein [bacterium]